MRICGLDEVGRGALAGPLVAASAIINHQCPIPNLRDSKKLNKAQRERIYRQLMRTGTEYRIEIITARQINNRGMGWANKEIFRRLIKKIEADKYIVDGPTSLWGKHRASLGVKNVKCLIKADATRKCVMAASIIAKVTRDRMMQELHQKHNKYGWNLNAGYGTKSHILAIRENGTVEYHRSVYVTTALRTMVTTDNFP